MTETNKGTLQLPKGWILTTLEEVTERISNGTTEKQTKANEGVPVTRIETISNESIDLSRVGFLSNPSPEFIKRFKLSIGDILFSHINSDSHLGKTALFKLESYNLLHGMNLLLIRPCKEAIIPEFLNHLFRFYRFSGNFVAIAQHAVNQSSINQTKLKKLQVPIAPLAEQRRIVGKVEELFSFLDVGVGSLRRVQAQLERYRQAVLKYAFEGKLTEEWRKTHKGGYESAQAKPNDFNALLSESQTLPELPEEWRWVSFCSLVRNYQNGFSKRRSAEGEAVRVLRLADIENGKIVSRTPRQIKLTKDETKKFLLDHDDLLCIRVNGSKNNTGRLVVFTQKERWAFCDHLIRIRLVSGMLSQYAKNYFNTRLARKFIESSIISSAGQNTISQTSLDKIPFPLAPIEEQVVVAKKLEYFFSIVDYNEKAIENGISQAELLRQSVLKNAFEGKLVPQDANDEPAEKLLERIKAEHFNNRKSKIDGQLELSHYVK